MATAVGLEEVVDHFTLVGDEIELLRNKTGATRLGFVVLLKFLLWRGGFPRSLADVPPDAVAHLARQVEVAPGQLAGYDLAGRTAKRHRTEIRAYTGYRECSVAVGSCCRTDMGVGLSRGAGGDWRLGTRVSAGVRGAGGGRSARAFQADIRGLVTS